MLEIKKVLLLSSNCVETYKATNGLAPVYVSDIFQRKLHVHSYSLRDTNTLLL